MEYGNMENLGLDKDGTAEERDGGGASRVWRRRRKSLAPKLAAETWRVYSQTAHRGK